MALLHFSEVIGLNGANYDSERSHYAGVQMLKIMYQLVYRRFFHNGSAVVFSSVFGTLVT